MFPLRHSVLYLTIAAAGLLSFSCCSSQKTQVPPDKTIFQTGQGWTPYTDNRADAVMVYGVGGNPSDPASAKLSLESRISSWKERGYEPYFMTGIAWGAYSDYFTGEWDGVWHLDEGQVQQSGDTLWHGQMTPYIVPSENYLSYFKERVIKRVIDAGVDAIFLEEPEFWASGGYSDSFKREWKEYYGSDWRPQHESPEATYLSSKLKYHLYYRALEETFSYAKEYGKSLGRDIKCYVPTHSLLNYSMWEIISPEASLASLPCVDGYIAQVWTGTSRAPVYYDGRRGERVFETAFLEYGCMASMVEPTGRRVWFLTDPIEDWARDWEDFKENYKATFTAQMLYPGISDYEIMPWPERIYRRPYKKSADSDEKVLIPKDFSTMMHLMTNAAQNMPHSSNHLDGSEGISVLMGNSLMFQRFPLHDGYDDPQLSNFFGLAMPLLKKGVPVGITHIENLGYEKTLEDVKVLLMTYSNMKPLESAAHDHLAQWVKEGGHLIYSATDTDPFQGVEEWWNTGGNSFERPFDHLLTLLGLPAGAGEGTYGCGKGKLTVLRHDPKEYVLEEGRDDTLLRAVEDLYGEIHCKNHFVLDRGPYRLVAVMDEGGNEPYTLEGGPFIDIYDPSLPVYGKHDILPGSQGLFYDISKAPKAPCILAASSRAYDEKETSKRFSYTCKGPEETVSVTRIKLSRSPRKVLLNGQMSDFRWDEASETILLTFDNDPDGVKVEILL